MTNTRIEYIFPTVNIIIICSILWRNAISYGCTVNILTNFMLSIICKRIPYSNFRVLHVKLIILSMCRRYRKRFIYLIRILCNLSLIWLFYLCRKIIGIDKSGTCNNLINITYWLTCLTAGYHILVWNRLIFIIILLIAGPSQTFQRIICKSMLLF